MIRSRSANSWYLSENYKTLLQLVNTFKTIMQINKKATALVVVGTIAALAVISSNSGLDQGTNLLGHHDLNIDFDLDSTFA
jgi:choline-glycine betaine transporter